jgi:hypothetical protein
MNAWFISVSKLAIGRDVIAEGTPDKEHHYKAMAGSLNQTDAGMEEAVGNETFKTLTALTRCKDLGGIGPSSHHPCSLIPTLQEIT